MNPLIRQQIAEALGLEWQAFTARHPSLARVMDQSAAAEEIAARLSEDPEYQRAMAQAQTAGAIAARVQNLIRSFTKDWLARLF